MSRPGTSSEPLDAGPSRCVVHRRRRGMALLIVVLTIAALAILAAPFILSMRLQERSSRTAVARTRARYAVTAAYHHALAQLLAATNEYGELAVDFSGLPAEFRWVRGRSGLILHAEIQDEQGKLNVNTARASVMTTLFADADLHLGLTWAEAAQLAQAVVTYRNAEGNFATLDALRREALLTAEQLARLRPCLTVHSAAEADGAFARININTCRTAVLRAALAGVRMNTVQPEAGSNVGDGRMSAVELKSDTAAVWEVRCTGVQTDADTDARTFTFTVESYPENDPDDRTNHGEFEIVEYPNAPSGTTVSLADFTFSLFNGDTDFAVGDSFTFSTERFSFVGDAFDPTKVDRLLKRFRAKVVSVDAAAGTLTLDDASKFPAEGWVRVRGDLVRFTGRDGNQLTGCSDLAITPAPGDEVIRIVPDLAALDAILEAAVEDGDLRESDRSALLANAKRPVDESDDAVLRDATAGFCFRPSGRYGIEVAGVVNDAAGREVRRMRVRRVVSLEHGTAVAWTLAEQGEFDAAVAARGLAGLLTTPGASFLADVPPASGTENAGVTLAPISETAGGGWTFDGPVRSAAGEWVYPGTNRSPAVAGSLVAGEHLFPNGDKGLFVGGSDALRTFAAASELLEEAGRLRRLLVWVKPGETFDYGADHVFFDTGLPSMSDAADAHTNRILLAYRSSGQLVFRVAGEARENRSSEIRADVAESQFARGAWHRIEALWCGTDVGRMALLLDGKLVGAFHPSGSEAEQKAVPPLAGERWIVRVGNYLRQEGTAGAVRDTQVGSTAGPTSVYGYGACAFVNKDASTQKAAFNRVHRGGATLSEGIKKRFWTRIRFVPPATGPLAADAATIPVEDASDFPAEGYIKIDDEVIHYSSRTATALTVAADGRGCDFGVGDLATKFTSEPAEHADGATVLCISLKVSSNADYPMPRLLDVPANVENYFGLQGLDPNWCWVQIDDEWIAYTHRAGTQFLVNVQAQVRDIDPDDPGQGKTSSMRGQKGTDVADHSSGAKVLPVYEVTAGGRMGAGDRLTLLDDDLAPGQRVELAAKRAVSGASGYLVAFDDFLPASPRVYIKKGTRGRNARLVKFPSGRFALHRRVSIGAPSSGAGARAESVIGCVRVVPHFGSDVDRRIKEPIDGTSAGGFDLVFGTLQDWYNGGTEWAWNASDGLFGVPSWPLCGYVKIGGEAFFYKVRYPHNIGYSATLGAMSQSCSVKVYGDAGVPATGNIVWTRQFDAVDPITAGFNPYGGYLVITSYTRTKSSTSTKKLEDCSNELLQWLIANGYVTQEYVDQHGTYNEETGLWSFPEITEEGGWVTSEKREFVFYSEINPKTPGADQYTFVCDASGRHLYGTHKDPDGSPLGHAPADDGEGGKLYPTLSARTVALAVLQRGGAPGTLGLGTARSAQHAGSRLLPLPNVPATILCGPPTDEDGNPADAYEGDRLPVESTAGFPDSGYLEITDGFGSREILYYTHKAEAVVPGSNPVRKRYFFCGVRRFRGRFGTRPIDLTGLSAFDDVRDTSDAQIAAYRDPRRAVRLFRPRVHDRMPLRITMDGGAEASRAYAPHPDDSAQLFFEVTRTVRGAKWLSVDWAETLPPNTDVIVLARVGDSPDWGTAEPVKWDEVPAGSGRVIYKFDAPKSDPNSDDENAINATGDTITVRVYFKFNPGYDLGAWQVPVLRSLTLRYEATPAVVESQVLDY